MSKYIISTLLFISLAIPFAADARSLKDLTIKTLPEILICGDAPLKENEMFVGCFESKTNTISVMKGQPKAVLIHEMGHFILHDATFDEIKISFNIASTTNVRQATEHIANKFVNYTLGEKLPQSEKIFFDKYMTLLN